MKYTDPIAFLLGTWSSEINVFSILLRIMIAVLLAAVIGCERASKRHAAGLRTFMIVSLASSLASLFDSYLIMLTNGIPFVSAAAVIGIAVISSNSILFSSRNKIKGLTTSFGLWACGILGLTVGAGYYTVTLIGFAALISCLSLFPPFEAYLKNRSNHFEMHLELKNKSNLPEFTATIRKLGLRIDDIESNPAYLNSGLSVYSVAVTISSDELKKYKKHSEIIEALSTLEYVHHIEEMN
ncbi:MAG: MgtC/SapB family protein [Ruminococcaceae bacterium]|nr:MgtC/SapB family protein [Oscillospiraceae bacterium]